MESEDRKRQREEHQEEKIERDADAAARARTVRYVTERKETCKKNLIGGLLLDKLKIFCAWIL